MPELSAPDLRFYDSFRAAIVEFQSQVPLSDWISHIDADRIQSAEGFELYVADLHARRTREVSSPDGPVPESSLWWVEGDEFLGRIAVRHQLNPSLKEFGGHIGYAIRPSAQGKGHASALLRATLPIAYALGIDDALLTTEPENLASRRVIERNGGRLVRQTAERCHYRLRTHISQKQSTAAR
jgi:predicted acetyltransferase